MTSAQPSNWYALICPVSAQVNHSRIGRISGASRRAVISPIDVTASSSSAVVGLAAAMAERSRSVSSCVGTTRARKADSARQTVKRSSVESTGRSRRNAAGTGIDAGSQGSSSAMNGLGFRAYPARRDRTRFARSGMTRAPETRQAGASLLALTGIFETGTGAHRPFRPSVLRL